MTESRVILLTGCASGIGRRLAADLYRAGHSLIATDLDEPRLRAAAEDWTDVDRVLVARLDVREAESWESLLDGAIDRFGRLDVVCNVAGLLVARWSHEMTLAEVGLTVDVNVKGVIFGSNAAARRMIRQGSGHIVNIASVAGIAPVPGMAVYSATKHAVRAFSIAIAHELRPLGIDVTVVCPGPVDTPMLEVQLPHDEAALMFSGSRALSTEEVSRAIVDRALPERPLELVIPVPGSGQGTLARVAGALPELGRWMLPVLSRRGRRNQDLLRSGKS